MTTLQCNIKKIRTELGLTQAQMARDIEMSVKDLWQIENGRNVTMFTAKTIFVYLKNKLPTLEIESIWPDLSIKVSA
jgi:DNA-binding XRE family transcriptional regulator